jgi:glutaminyl-tRNA synthetase
LDENGGVLELKCAVDLETRNGKPADGRKVKGTAHWLDAKTAESAEIRYYNPLFNKENAAALLEEDTFEEFLADDSLVVYKDAKLEPGLAAAKAEERFQFVRVGYFTKDSKREDVFNRIAPLKSGYTEGK